MKNIDTAARFANFLHGESKKDWSGLGTTSKIKDLILDVQNYLEMLQINGIKETVAKKEIGDDLPTMQPRL